MYYQILRVLIIVVVIFHVGWGLFKKNIALIDFFKFIEEKAKLFLPSGPHQNKWACIIATGVIVIIILIVFSFAPSTANIKGFANDDITEKTASFDIITENGKGATWKVCLICSSGREKKIASGRGKKVCVENLLPNTKYKVTASGENTRDYTFTTEKLLDIHLAFLEFENFNFSDKEKVAVTLHNCGKATIKKKLNYKIMDKQGNLTSHGTKTVKLSGGQEKKKFFSNKNGGIKIEIYDENGLLGKN